jgi:hypothetical protein
MEELQSAPGKIPDKTIIRGDTDFDSDAFDGTPMKKSMFSGWNDRIFEMMRPKRKKLIRQQPLPQPLSGVPSGVPFSDSVGRTSVPDPAVEEWVNGTPVKYRAIEIPRGFEVQNGLLIRSKNLAERVRDQLRFPIVNKVPAITNGVALLVFAVGTYILYAELPTHPELVVGMVLCIIAGNVIVSNRG